jgi:hypothetical protein
MPDDEKTTEQLKRIIELLQAPDGTSALRAIIIQNTAILANQAIIIDQNKQIIQLLTPAPDNDISSLGGSISPPTKINP